MDHVRQLPSHLVQRYKGWRATTFEDNSTWYRRLAAEGQTPQGMIIACVPLVIVRSRQTVSSIASRLILGAGGYNRIASSKAARVTGIASGQSTGSGTVSTTRFTSFSTLARS